MTGEEAHLRAHYLLTLCARTVERCATQLQGSPSLSRVAQGPVTQKALRRELGILFRYWATREIWQRWESKEADATQMNLALLRCFTDELKLPKDGSGLRYAELSTVEEEMRELSRRIGIALDVEADSLLGDLHHTIAPSREVVLQSTVDALETSVTRLSNHAEQQHL